MDTVTRTFSKSLTNSYIPNSIIELSHFRNMIFDDDERIAIYLEAFFCNLNLKSFTLGNIPSFDGSESEIEKMAKFNASEAKSQKVGLRILTRKDDIGDWEEKAEITLVNRGRKDYFDLMQPYLSKYQVRIFEKNDAIAIQLIDYGNGLLKTTDSLGLQANFTVTIAKKNDIEALQTQINTLQLALEGKLINLPSNSLLGRNTDTGVVEIISQSKFATPAMIEQAIIDLAGGAPGALNTLIELAAALNNDANFASTIANNLASITNNLALKAPIASPVFTGFITLGGNVASKTIMMEGMTGAAQGDQVSVPHGITGAKIISVTGLIFYASGSCVPINSRQAGYATTWAIISTHFFLTNESNNSNGILSKAFRVVIEYTA